MEGNGRDNYIIIVTYVSRGRETMMTSQLDQATARALAALVTLIRPDWDATGIMAALGKVRDRGSAVDVAIAALRVADDPKNRTPAVIVLTGDHWAAPTQMRAASTVPRAGATRCPEPGHEHEIAANCRSCRAEQIAITDGTSTPTIRDPLVSAERVRQILDAAFDETRPVDHQRLAAGDAQ